MDSWRDAAEQSRAYHSGYFWGQGDVLTVLLKGETPEPVVRQLKNASEAVSGIAIRGDVSQSPRQSGLSFYIPLSFRRAAPLGKWSEAIVDDARLIVDPQAK